RYAPTRPFWPWVWTIARRLCIDHGRRLRTARRKDPGAGAPEQLADPTPEGLVEADADYRRARGGLPELRPEHRRLTRLRGAGRWPWPWARAPQPFPGLAERRSRRRPPGAAAQLCHRSSATARRPRRTLTADRLRETQGARPPAPGRLRATARRRRCRCSFPG